MAENTKLKKVEASTQPCFTPFVPANASRFGTDVLKVDIAALRETRFSEQSPLEDVGAGYNVFWSGSPKSERRDAGVAFAVWDDIVKRLSCLPQGINDCLMSLCPPL
nr:unnamed protein product [Spirometra erinaceieuropaei]